LAVDLKINSSVAVVLVVMSPAMLMRRGLGVSERTEQRYYRDAEANQKAHHQFSDLSRSGRCVCGFQFSSCFVLAFIFSFFVSIGEGLHQGIIEGRHVCDLVIRPHLFWIKESETASAGLLVPGCEALSATKGYLPGSLSARISIL
jgi:hypothetical protein